MNDKDLKPNYYAIIPSQVRYDKNLRANEKLLFGEIMALTDKTGECWASNNYFAELYDVTPQAISKWIKNLEEKGYISIKYLKNKTNNSIDKRVIKGVSTNIDRGINKSLIGYQQKFKENNTSNSNNNIEEDDFLKIFKLIESEFGRTISPLESEIIKNWNYPFEIVKLAISEAVSRNAFSFKYIDQIIYRWQKNGIKTIEEAENQIMKFNEKKAIDNQSKIRDETIDADYGGFEVLK